MPVARVPAVRNPAVALIWFSDPDCSNHKAGAGSDLSNHAPASADEQSEIDLQIQTDPSCCTSGAGSGSGNVGGCSDWISAAGASLLPVSHCSWK